MQVSDMRVKERAMIAWMGLTYHVWSVAELLTYKVTPVAWIEPKRGGRLAIRLMPEAVIPKRPKLRLLKGFYAPPPVNSAVPF